MDFQKTVLAFMRVTALSLVFFFIFILLENDPHKIVKLKSTKWLATLPPASSFLLLFFEGERMGKWHPKSRSTKGWQWLGRKYGKKMEELLAKKRGNRFGEIVRFWWWLLMTLLCVRFSPNKQPKVGRG
jgi:hypothetical protein